MVFEYRELKTNDYTLRGSFLYPEDGYDQLVVFLHGHTGNKNECGDMFKQLAYNFAEHKIASLRYDYYGSGDSDGFFVNQNFDTVIENAVAFIKDGYQLNHNQPIIVLGFSMGGGVAAFISNKYQDMISKLVLIAPASRMKDSFEYTFNNSPLIDNYYVDKGGYLESKKFLETASKLDFYEGVENFKKPVLIMQGSEDLAVDPKYSKKYADFFPDVKFVLVEGATHGFSKVPYRKELNDTIINFLIK